MPTLIWPLATKLHPLMAQQRPNWTGGRPIPELPAMPWNDVDRPPSIGFGQVDRPPIASETLPSNFALAALGSVSVEAKRTFQPPYPRVISEEYRIPAVVHPLRPYTPTTLTIFGVTKDSSGVALGNCVVHLFRTADDLRVDSGVSDALGNYEFRGASSSFTYYVVAYKAGSPDVAGTTVNTISPAAGGSAAVVNHTNLVTNYGATVHFRMGEPSGHLTDRIAGLVTSSETTPTYGLAGAMVNDTDTGAVANPFSLPTNTAYAIDDSTPFSIEMWVKQTATGATRTIYDFGHGTLDGPLLFVDSADILRFTDSAFANAGLGYRFINAFTDTLNWHQIVITMNGHATSAMYLDGGATLGTLDAGAVALGVSSNNLHWCTTNMQGDEYAIYKNVVLTPTQVANLYHAAGY